MPNWKRVRITFPTVKLNKFIEPVKTTVAEQHSDDYRTVFGVTNVEGITITGKKASEDISKYIAFDKECFAYNPYRINVGSIGFNSSGLKGCVSPAYVVFRTKSNLSPEFLYLYLKSEFGNHLINWYGNRGGVRNALRYDDLGQIDIPAVDFEKQIELLKKIDRSKPAINSLTKELSLQLSFLNQLRQAVLQEAIEGKLTAQWRKEHPDLISGENHASKLLEKIKAEKERLIKEGKIKKEKPLPSITEEEKPFDLPDGWVWCRLERVVNIKSGKRIHASDYKSSGVPFLRSGEIGTLGRGEKIDAPLYISEQKYNDIKLRFGVPKAGDILIACIGGSIGNTWIVDERRFYYKDGNLVLIELNEFIAIKYLLSYLTTPFFIKNTINNATDTSYNALTIIKLNNAVFPLPPLNEQKVIVEQVAKVMAIIDGIEKQVSERKEQSEMLMRAVLREAFEYERK